MAGPICRRAIGLEIELDTPIFTSNKIHHGGSDVAMTIIRDAHDSYGMYLHEIGTGAVQYWAPNGSQWYIDRTYLELATAEATCAREAVALSRAGLEDIAEISSLRNGTWHWRGGSRHDGNVRVFALNQEYVNSEDPRISRKLSTS